MGGGRRAAAWECVSLLEDTTGSSTSLRAALRAPPRAAPTLTAPDFRLRATMGRLAGARHRWRARDAHEQ